MKTKFLVCAFLLFSCLTSWAGAPARITQANVNQIQVGQTTEAELVALFGTPTMRTTDLTHRITMDWLRSVPAPAQSYIPLVGSFFGGMDLDAQHLYVVLTPDGRVIRYEVHSSRESVKATRVTTVSRSGYSK